MKPKILPLLAQLTVVSSAFAVDYQWNGTTNSAWTTSTNWSVAGVPAYAGTFTADRLQIYSAANPAVYDPVADAAGNVTTTFGGPGTGGGTSGRGLVVGNAGFGDGALTINSGTLKIGGTASPLMGNSQNATLIINGGLLDTTTNGGTAFVMLFGGSSSITNTITLNGGELRTKLLDLDLGNGGTATTAPASTVTLGTGATFTTTGIIRSQTGVNSGTSTVTFNGGTLKAGASSGTFFNNLARTTAIVDSGGAIIDTVAFDVTIAKSLTAGSGTGGLTKNGSGNLMLSGANTYTGNTTVTSGTLTIANAAGLGAPGGVNSVTTNGAAIALSGGITVNGEDVSIFGIVNARGALQSAFGTNTFGGAVTIGNNTTTRIGTQNGANLILNGTITGGVGANLAFRVGTGSFVTVAGSGSSWLGATETFGGTLKNGINDALSTGSVFSMGFNTLTTDNVYDLNGFSQTVAGLANLSGLQASGSNTITNSGSTDSTLTLGATTDRSFSGILKDGPTNKVSLVKNGSFKQTLAGASTYTGDTTVNAGVLSMSNAFLADSSSLNIASAAKVDLNFSGTDTVNKLFIDGVEMAGGTWGSTASGALHPDDVHFTGSGKLYVTGPAVTYASWTSTKGFTVGVNDGKADNPDNDGLNNLGEFAFNGNPLSGTSDGKIVSKIATINSERVLTLTLPVLNGATFPAGFSARVSDPIGGLIYYIECSDTLETFELPVEEVTNLTDLATIQGTLPTDHPLDGGWSYRTFRFAPVADLSKQFVRARVTEAP